MAEYYQALMASLSDGITNVFDCLPFCRFSSQQNFNIVTAKREHLLLQSRSPRKNYDVSHLLVGVSDDAHRPSL